MIKKILVPIDGAEHSEKAINFALDLAEKYSAEVKMLSVVKPVIISRPLLTTQPMLSAPTNTIFVKEIEVAHGKILEESFKRAKQINPNTNIKLSKQLVTGRPADRIVDIAEKENFDLIVMGSIVADGIKKFFLGSVSDRVADEANCSVLLVK